MKIASLLVATALFMLPACKSPPGAGGGFVPVKSSVLDSVRYDKDAQSLVVLFDNGDIYEYYGVPPEVYHELLTADSKGRYFHQKIRDKYRYKKW